MLSISTNFPSNKRTMKNVSVWKRSEDEPYLSVYNIYWRSENEKTPYQKIFCENVSIVV